jgi:Tol biopolymer transport system component
MSKVAGFLRRRAGVQRAGWISLVLLVAGGSAGFAAGGVELVSQVDPGQYSDTGTLASLGFAYPPPSLSADGRYVAFVSPATNLVPGQNGVHPSTGIPPQNVFLHDRVTGTTTLVSHAVTSPTATADDISEVAVLSADGRWLAFLSQATDLVTGPEGTSGGQDRLLLYDRVSGTTTLVSSTSHLDQDNGRGVQEVALSADGRYVAYVSDAPDLVPGQRDVNDQADIFLYDRTTGKTSLISHVSGSATTAADYRSQYVSISADGRFIAFQSLASNLLPNQGNAGVFLYDRVSGKITAAGVGGYPTMSADGSSIAFLGSTDVFLYQRTTGSVSLVSHQPGQPASPAGGSFELQVRPTISADGRFVAFLSDSSYLVPTTDFQFGPSAFLYDRTSGAVVLASRSGSSANAFGGQVFEPPSVSADGRFVTLVSASKTMVPGEVDTNGAKNVFLFDRLAGKTTLVSSGSGGTTTTGDGNSSGVAISANGAQVAFYSTASDLVSGTRDLNLGQDTLLYDTAARTSSCISLHAASQPSATPNAVSALGQIGGDGRYVLFLSQAPNLVSGQVPAGPLSNLPTNVFLFDRVSRSSVLVSHASDSPVTPGDDVSGPALLSADGRYVAFLSDATNLVAGVSRPVDPRSGRAAVRKDLFLYDRVTGSTVLVSRSALDPGFTGNAEIQSAAFSADGRWIAFTSQASDLVPGITYTNNASQVFLYDRVTGATTLITGSAVNPSHAGDGSSFAGALSADGRYVTLLSQSSDLVPGQAGSSGYTSYALFLFDRVAGTTAVVSHALNAPTQVEATNDGSALSADGRYVVFVSGAGLADGPSGQSSDLTIYSYDRTTGAVRYVSHSPDGFIQPSISADGRWIAFLSNFDRLVPGFINSNSNDSQAYLFDQVSGTLSLLTPSATVPGRASQGGAQYPQVSQDGHYVAFAGGDVIPGQLGATGGIYLYDRLAGTITLASRTLASDLTSGGGYLPLLSADGRSVAFHSTSPDLVAGDFNAGPDVFLFSLDFAPPAGGPTTVSPCRLFNGPLPSNLQKVLAVAGSCGVPATATRVTVKVTARQETGAGNLRLYPGNAVTTPAGTLRFQGGQTVTSSFDFPLATNGAGTIAILPLVRGNGTVRVTVEVDGYTP